MLSKDIVPQLGVGRVQVSLWRANGLKPHIVRGFKVWRDPKFAEKLEHIVGLYLSPPEHALVLCCDEVIRANGRLSSKQNATLH